MADPASNANPVSLDAGSGSNVTETSSKYDHLEQMSIRDLVTNMNNEDKTVPFAIEKALPQIEKLIEAGEATLRNGGRVFYVGAGTSGRLGILDAAECPPTFGVPPDMIIGLIAGGMTAIQKAVEFAEDNLEQAWIDLQAYNVSSKDMVIGIAASGRTPYVVGALRAANQNGLVTGCIVCNSSSPVAAEAQVKVEVVVGPEFVTGSTRLKSGTAQKLVLNMFSTAVLIRMGRVKGNKMVDMQLTNRKLQDRGARMVAGELGVPYEEAADLLARYGSVRSAVDSYRAEQANL